MNEITIVFLIFSVTIVALSIFRPNIKKDKDKPKQKEMIHYAPHSPLHIPLCSITDKDIVELTVTLYKQNNRLRGVVSKESLQEFCDHAKFLKNTLFKPTESKRDEYMRIISKQQEAFREAIITPIKESTE